MKMAVFDIDGTILKERNWGDKVGAHGEIPGALNFVKQKESDGYIIAYCTARPEENRQEIKAALGEYGFPYRNELLFCLPNEGDNVPRYKKTTIEGLMQDYDVQMFFDDVKINRSVVKKLGVPTVDHLPDVLKTKNSRRNPRRGPIGFMYDKTHGFLTRNMARRRQMVTVDEVATYPLFDEKRFLDPDERMLFDDAGNRLRQNFLISAAMSDSSGGASNTTLKFGGIVGLDANGEDYLPANMKSFRTESQDKYGVEFNTYKGAWGSYEGILSSGSYVDGHLTDMSRNYAQKHTAGTQNFYIFLQVDNVILVATPMEAFLISRSGRTGKNAWARLIDGLSDEFALWPDLKEAFHTAAKNIGRKRREALMVFFSQNDDRTSFRHAVRDLAGNPDAYNNGLSLAYSFSGGSAYLNVDPKEWLETLKVYGTSIIQYALLQQGDMASKVAVDKKMLLKGWEKVFIDAFNEQRAKDGRNQFDKEKATTRELRARAARLIGEDPVNAAEIQQWSDNYDEMHSAMEVDLKEHRDEYAQLEADARKIYEDAKEAAKKSRDKKIERSQIAIIEQQREKMADLLKEYLGTDDSDFDVEELSASQKELYEKAKL